MNEISNDLTVLRGDYAKYRRTAGNVTLTGTTTWSTLTTIGTAADLTLAAASGDVIEFSVSLLVGQEAVNSGFDVVTCNGPGGSPINSVAYDGAYQSAWTTHQGMSGWLCFGSAFVSASGSVFYKLVAGDIVSNAVTLRLLYAMGAATNKTLYAGTQIPFDIWARNHGPVEI